MADIPLITSTQNPHLKEIVKLKKRRTRDQTKLLLVEGVRPIERALNSDYEFIELYICPDFYGTTGVEAEIVNKFIAKNIKITCLSKQAFMKLAYREHPEGLLAVGRQWSTNLSDLSLSENPFLIIVESVEKPGNLGTILRTADATGADAVIVCDPATDIFNPNVVRASTGTLFSKQIAVASSSDAIEFLKTKSIQTIAALPQAKITYTAVDMTGPTAIVMGSEDAGLSKIWADNCDTPVKLPMLGIADSLNVSAATVAIAYEILRQRNR